MDYQPGGTGQGHQRSH